MAKGSCQNGKQTQAPVDPEMAACAMGEVLRFREQIKKEVAKRKKKIRRVH